MSRSVFDKIEVVFFPVRHTRTDIDQAFSTTPRRPDTHTAVKVNDLHRELSDCYNDRTVVNSPNNFINWSALCKQPSCIRKISGIMLFRFIQFSRDSEVDLR